MAITTPPLIICGTYLQLLFSKSLLLFQQILKWTMLFLGMVNLGCVYFSKILLLSFSTYYSNTTPPSLHKKETQITLWCWSEIRRKLPSAPLTLKPILRKTFSISLSTPRTLALLFNLRLMESNHSSLFTVYLPLQRLRWFSYS